MSSQKREQPNNDGTDAMSATDALCHEFAERSRKWAVIGYRGPNCNGRHRHKYSEHASYLVDLAAVADRLIAERSIELILGGDDDELDRVLAEDGLDRKSAAGLARRAFYAAIAHLNKGASLS